MHGFFFSLPKFDLVPVIKAKRHKRGRTLIAGAKLAVIGLGVPPVGVKR